LRVLYVNIVEDWQSTIDLELLGNASFFFIEGMESMVKSKQEKNPAKLQRDKIVHS